ncbi:hypothetical protein [Shewanella baltica]|uniref:hypothetical protein n=1 Tax=Shewanella baltica TaxID=62322 RepID=UPI003D0298F2
MQKVMQSFGAPLFFIIFNGLRHEVGSLSPAKLLNKNSDLRVAVFVLGTIWDPNVDFNIVV